MNLERVWAALWRHLPERPARALGRMLPERKIRARTRLVTLLPRGGTGAEVGVWRGDFAEVLLRALQPDDLLLVDSWQFRPEYGESLYGGAAARSQEDMDAVYRHVLRRFEANRRVRVRRQESLRAARDVEPETLDWVYLDAEHTYEAVRRDLSAWASRVRPGGFVCGDDYGVRGWWGSGVTRAVYETIEATALRPVLIYGGQYALRKPGGGESP